MARLRQQHPQNYTSSGNISVEFENLVRYLNTAELGNKTLSELLQSIFDPDGNFSGPMAMRHVPGTGIQYRIGDYDSAEAGWVTIVKSEDLRGTPGREVGTIGDSIFQARYSFIASADNEQTYDLAFDPSAEDLLVYHNGILRSTPAHYTLDPTGGVNNLGSITLVDPVVTDDQIDIFKIRVDANPGYRREEQTTLAAQNLFFFAHDANERVLVYRNGILLQPGGERDYLTNPDTNTVTFTDTLPINTLVTL